MPDARPRVLITGACRGVGRECAETLAARGAELILADHDSDGLRLLSPQLDAVGRYCDVASEASVTVFAAEILERYESLEMVINTAGGGYERTLGMYRVSRALLPALRNGSARKILLNIPPADKDSGDAIFPYASSQQAFQRLCAALAAETRGSAIRVLIGQPGSDHISQVLPDRNAGSIADAFDVVHHTSLGHVGFAAHVASLFDPPEDIRRAG
ncbi:MAG TPA: SDR family oxidoreductase [Sphingomicrobium sp.]|nr:SDR family oxidoreductase [Sphingomicrobium sp.]